MVPNYHFSIDMVNNVIYNEYGEWFIMPSYIISQNLMLLLSDLLYFLIVFMCDTVECPQILRRCVYMKKSTKILSMLMAFVMFFTSMSICASAAYSSYEQPGGYNTLGVPYLTADQCGSIMLDYLDGLMAKENIIVDEGLSILPDLYLNFTSVDRSLQSIIDFIDGDLFDLVDTFNLGDIDDLDIYWIRQSPRRTTAGRTDLEIVYCLCKFLAANKTIVGKAVEGTLDIGTVGTFFDISEYIGDIPGTLKTKVYSALFKEDVYGAMPAGMTVDQMVIQKLNYALVNDPVTQKEGLLPSLSGKLDIDTVSGYSLFRNAFNAALSDIAIPKLTTLLVDLLEIDTSENPDGVYYGTSDLSIVWDLLINNGKVPFSDDALDKPVKMIEEALDYYLLGDFLDQYIQITEDGWTVLDTLDDALHTLLIAGAGVVSGFSLQGVTFKTSAELEVMSNSELFAYLAKMLLIGFVDFSDIPDSAQTLREVATYFLINVAADIIPEKDYYAKINAGALNPSTTGCLEVAAGLIRYYLNANTEMNILDNLTFEQTVDHIINWVIAKYGGVICTSGMASDSAWKKLDKILFGNSPYMCGILQANWLPTTVNSSNITYDLLFNKIIFAILDFDLDELVSIIHTNPTGDLNNCMAEVALNLIARIVNGVFENNVIIPLNTTRLETIFTKSTLRSIVEALLSKLSVYVEPIFVSALPLIVDLLGLWDPSAFDVAAPEGTVDVSIEELENIVYTQVPKEQDVEYDEEGYIYFGSENYSPLYHFYDYQDERKAATSLIKKFETDPTQVTQEEITNTAYRLTYYYNRLIYKQPNVVQLGYMIEDLKNVHGLINSRYGISATNSAYSLRTWNQLKRAYTFAYDIYMDVLLGTDSTITQAMVSEARGQLNSAVKSLKPYTPLANYTTFRSELNTAKGYTESELNRYFEEGVAAFREVLARANDFALDYDRDSQTLVDDMTVEIQDAIAGLSFKPAITKVDDTTTAFDPINKFVFGLKTGLSSYFSFVTNVGPGYIEPTPTSNGSGTGTVISLIVNGEVIDSYTVAIFGDVDGDGKTNANDSLLVSLYADGLLSSSSSFSPVQSFAADENHDGYVDANDSYDLEMAGLYAYSVNQTP